jgi:hypothetical protein
MESVTTCVVGTSGKFTNNVTTISVNLRKDVNVSVVDFDGKFAAGVSDAGDQFPAGVIYTCGAPRVRHTFISSNFRKKMKWR